MDINNTETNINIDTDTNSDSDDYIDLSSQMELLTNDIYQFIIEEENLHLKHIGKFTTIPDIIIKENFGSESNMNLYSCVYSIDELLTNTNSEELFYPLVKLVIKKSTNVIITCIAIKLKKSIEQNNLSNTQINDWELYWIENKSDAEHIKMCLIEKNINPSNIIEKLIEYSVNN